MQKKFQIFVSSTYQDLIEERRAVIEAILDLGHIPIGMEAFQASNEEQWSYIKKRIDETDYYVVIVAERYGSTNIQGVSYTEMEYDYAREKGVPVAAFLLHNNARSDWRSKKADSIDDRKKVDEFREKCQGLMVRFWNNKDELAAACIKSLSHMFSAFPRDGWIPANSGISAETANEFARISSENELLRKRIDEMKRENSSDDRAESIIDYLKSKHIHEFIIDTMLTRQHGEEIFDWQDRVINDIRSATILDGFIAICPHLLLGCNEFEARIGIMNLLQDLLQKELQLDGYIESYAADITMNLLRELTLIEIVSHNEKKVDTRHGSHFDQYWKLNELGRKIYRTRK